MFLAVTLLATDAGAHPDDFPRPAGIEHQIRFWTRVYSEVDRTGGFIHDTSQLDVIYQSPRGRLPLIEVGLGLWAATTSLLAFSLGLWGTAMFHGLFAGGLLWVGCRSLPGGLRRPAAAVPRLSTASS